MSPLKKPSFKSLESSIPRCLFLLKSGGIILQNWVYCLKVAYEAICLKYTDTLSVIKEVINLYSSRKTAVGEDNVKESPQNRVIYVDPTDARA